MNTSFNRRTFLQVSGGTAAAMSLGFVWPTHAQNTQPTEVNAWIDIHADDTVVIRYARTEMGQGSRTSAPMLIAEELEVEELIKLSDAVQAQLPADIQLL